MLTQISSGVSPPNTLKPQGSENRTAQARTGVDAQTDSPAIIQTRPSDAGLEVGGGMANVNAETATALNRTVLQTLALAIAAQMGVTRQDNETLESFFVRLVSVIEVQSGPEQQALELRSGLKALQIQLVDLTQALEEPDGALAARIAAAVEFSLATPQKSAEASITDSYLQSGATSSRSAETLVMSQHTREDSDGKGLFTNAALTQQDDDATPQALQAKLRQMFTPDTARPQPLQAAGQPLPVSQAAPASLPVAEAAGEDEAAPAVQAKQSDAIASQTQAQAQQTPSEVETAETAQAPAIAKLVVNVEAQEANPVAKALPQASTSPTASTLTAAVAVTAEATAAIDEQSTDPTAFVRKAETETATVQNRTAIAPQALAAASLTELALSALFDEDGPASNAAIEKLLFQAETTTARLPQSATERPEQSLIRLLAPNQAQPAGQKMDMPSQAATAPQKADAIPATPQQHAPEALARPASEALASETLLREQLAARAQTSLAANAAANQDPAAPVMAHAAAQAIAFPYAPIPLVREKFVARKPEEAEEEKSQGGEEEKDGNEEREDPEARRERLEKKAREELLKPEPEAEPALRITRDSSESDRAFALYQKMGGF